MRLDPTFVDNKSRLQVASSLTWILGGMLRPHVCWLYRVGCEAPISVPVVRQ